MKFIRNLVDKLLTWYFTKNALPYWCVLIADCIICYLAGLFTFWISSSASAVLANFVFVSKTIVIYMVFNLIGFRVFHTYAGIIRYSSFVDLLRVAYAMALSCVIAEIAHYGLYYWNYDFMKLDARHILLMYIYATIGMWLFRIILKTVFDVIFTSDRDLRTFIYGVKAGGVALAKNIRSAKPSRFQLKGFIANEKGYHGRVLMGVKVYEVREDFEQLLKTHRVQAVLVSPLQNEAFRSDERLQDMLIAAGVKIYMSPKTQEWKPEDDISKVQLKEISIEDLLPRGQIQVDMKAIGNLLHDKKILITGSAGSIGSEILRQICNYHPAELMLIDLAETPQHDILLMMSKRWPEIKTTTVVGSIANQERMEIVFSQFRPDYVFHAAAYKHVPMMENNPSEAVQNNIWGTKIIADLSVKYGVKKFVMLSTDKAVNPTNVMGCSKRICEIYTQSLNKAIASGTLQKVSSFSAGIQTQFVTTRFGNVLGSNGSVIPLFEEQIKAGGPVTVTDPNIIRYFMLIPEACKLVLEAGTHGKGGEIFVFDMGKPVRIADLAKRMIMLSGAKNVNIKYTGLRPGEKLYEEVLSTDENTIPSFHDKIRIAKVREYNYDEVEKEIEELYEISKTYDSMAIVRKMKQIVPEYKSNNSVFCTLDNEA